MDYKNIKVPYLDNKKIKEEAKNFRKKFWDNSIPIDIETIIDVKLKIYIIPILGFLRLASVDALISSDYKSIYVDKEVYLDERRHNRLRFSLAHEIGHFVLHKKVYNSFNIKNLEDYYRLNRNIPTKEYGYLETQANKFAGYLLVPREILRIEKQKELKRKNNPSWFKRLDRKTLNSYLAIPLSKTFNVSEDVIVIALGDLNEVK